MSELALKLLENARSITSGQYDLRALPCASKCSDRMLYRTAGRTERAIVNGTVRVSGKNTKAF